MKTFKSIQKNQAQLNSLLMEKWGYENEALEEQGPVTGRGQEQGTDKPPPKGKQGPVTGQGTNLPPPPPTEGRSVDEFTGDDPEFDFTDPDATPFDDPAAVNEDHNCKSAHPGMNHDQWANKHR